VANADEGGGDAMASGSGTADGPLASTRGGFALVLYPPKRCCSIEGVVIVVVP
jgi:hypothetical protein